MKFYETHFEEYISENNRINLHPKLDEIYKKFPSTIQEKHVVTSKRIENKLRLVPGDYS